MLHRHRQPTSTYSSSQPQIHIRFWFPVGSTLTLTNVECYNEPASNLIMVYGKYSNQNLKLERSIGSNPEDCGRI